MYVSNATTDEKRKHQEDGNEAQRKTEQQQQKEMWFSILSSMRHGTPLVMHSHLPMLLVLSFALSFYCSSFPTLARSLSPYLSIGRTLWLSMVHSHLSTAMIQDFVCHLFFFFFPFSILLHVCWHGRHPDSIYWFLRAASISLLVRSLWTGIIMIKRANQHTRRVGGRERERAIPLQSNTVLGCR